MNETDFRVDVFNSAIPLRLDNPDFWPTVIVVHFPTGLRESDRSTPMEISNKNSAKAHLLHRLCAIGIY